MGITIYEMMESTVDDLMQLTSCTVRVIVSQTIWYFSNLSEMLNLIVLFDTHENTYLFETKKLD